jgi:O-antigen/teichoic acid export membrane protein
MNQNIGNMSKQQQVKNAGIYLIPTIVSSILPLISLPIILRNLSPIEYGAYVLSLAFSSVVIGFCHFSLFYVYERNFFVYTNEKEKAQLLFTIVSFVLFTTLIVGILIFFNQRYIASWLIHKQEYGLLLLLTFFGWAFFNTSNYYLSFLQNTGKAKLNVTITVVASILGVILNIYFVAILKIGPLGLALGLLITNALIFIIVTTYFIYSLVFSIKLSLLISSLKLSMPLVPTALIGLIGKQFDKYIISVIASVGGTGIYAISQKLSNISFLFMTAIQKVYSPIVYDKMFSENEIDGGKEIGIYLTPFAFFSVAAALLVSLFSEEAIIILAPPEYLKGISIINILCISLAFGFFGKQPQIMYAGKTVVLSVLTLVYSICTVIILYLFVNEFGLLGAAVGNLLVSIIYNSLLIWQGQKYYRIEFEWLKLSVIYGMLIFMSISLLLFRAWELEYFYRLTIKIIYLGIFSGLGVYLNILTRENLLIIFQKRKNNQINNV